MAGIYIHIPFCKTRCIYCDFYSTTQTDLKKRYVQSLCNELVMRKEYLGGEAVETIYWGGGTPSQLGQEDFQEIFDTIDKVYGIGACKEITLEANPDDLSPAYLQKLSSLPFNRLSIGIQTFNDETLRFLRRRHNASQAINAVENARLAGYDNISIDLIYGLPGETLREWRDNLAQATALDIEHLSAYHLSYEKGTPIYQMLKKRQFKETSEEESISLFTTLIDHLSASGYEHYEISNFCKPDRYSLHNSSYWKGIKYLGCGSSAHSYDGESREWNVASIDMYIKGIEKNHRNREIELLDTRNRYNDLIVTAMRTQWGISLSQLEIDFGKKYLDHMLQMAQRHLKDKTLEITNNHLKLTRKGVFISDSIMSRLLYVDE